MTGYEDAAQENAGDEEQQEEQEEEQQEEQQEDQEYYQEELEEELQEEQDPAFEVTEVEVDLTEEEVTEVDVQDPAFDGLFQETLAAAEGMTEDEQWDHSQQQLEEDQTGGLAGADAGENGDLVDTVGYEDDGALVEENLNKISNPPF